MANTGKRMPKGKMFSKDYQPEKNGRPRKLPQLDIMLANILGKEDQEGITQGEQIIQALFEKAKKGDVKAAELLLDRGYGKAKQPIEGDIKFTEMVITRKVIK